jgi:hypothetical protein
LREFSEFVKFRNPEYAGEYADRNFYHVQGGVYILRKEMHDKIGTFNEKFPQNNMDVEYSYYAMSKGYELGKIPGVVSMTAKTRPTIAAHIDENIYVAHPLTISDARKYSPVVDRKRKFCNICGWSGKQFSSDDDSICPRCGSDSKERSLFRFFADSDLIYRKKRMCVVSELSPAFRREISKMFNCTDFVIDGTRKDEHELVLALSLSDLEKYFAGGFDTFKGIMILSEEESLIASGGTFGNNCIEYHRLCSEVVGFNQTIAVVYGPQERK